MTGGTGGLGTAVVKRLAIRLSLKTFCITGGTGLLAARSSRMARGLSCHGEDVKVRPMSKTSPIRGSAVKRAFDQVARDHRRRSSRRRIRSGERCRHLVEDDRAQCDDGGDGDAHRDAPSGRRRPHRRDQLFRRRSSNRRARRYVVSKSALNALIQVLAVELKDRAITVNALLPGSLGTPAKKPG